MKFRSLIFCSGLMVACGFAAPRGDVVAWGFGQPAPPAAASNTIVQIAAGSSHSLALRAEGTVVGWGFYGTPPPGLAQVAAIAAGANHSLAVRSNGTVIAWGENSSLQTNVPPINGVVAAAAGDFHSLALSSAGTVVGWGANNSGQAAPPSGLAGVVAIAAGGNFSLALVSSGRIVGWGHNSFGQALPPSPLRDGSIRVAAIAAGANHGLALDVSGNVYGWGQNTLGQASPPVGLRNVVAIAAGGDDSLALRDDGLLVAWGANGVGDGAPPAGLTNSIAIAVGDRQDVFNHKLALVFRRLLITSPPTNTTATVGQPASFSVTANGATPIEYQWRKDEVTLPLATGNTLVIPAVQRNDAGVYTVLVTAANAATTNLSATLTVNSPPEILVQPTHVTTNAGQTARFTVSATGTSPLHYQWRQDGTPLSGASSSNLAVFNVQPGDAGQYTVVITNSFGSITSQVAQLIVTQPPVITQQPQSQTVLQGRGVTFAVAADHATHFQWRKEASNLANQTNAILNINNAQFADSGNYSVLVSNIFGSVVSANASLNVQPAPAGPTNVVSWGQRFVFNGSEFVDTITPTGLSNAVKVAAGTRHNLALRDNRTVLGWGDNSQGQAAAPSDLVTVIAIAAGGSHSLALKADGAVVAWGANDMGQSSPPQSLTQVVAIAAGQNHSVAVRANGEFAGWGANSFGQRTAPPSLPSLTNVAAGAEFTLGLTQDGTVLGWGNNEFGQARPPTTLSNVVALAAGLSHSVALRRDGTVVVWGRNNHGQTNLPPNLANVIAIAAGANHCSALLASGRIIGWGQNNEGQTEVPADLVASSLAGGGDRSLAVVRRLYELLGPVRGPGDVWRIYIRTTDGSPITESQLIQIDVRATSNPALPVQNWSSLPPNFVLEKGLVRFDDLATSFLLKFYTVVSP